jgi:iron(III) transport system permease protein
LVVEQQYSFSPASPPGFFCQTQMPIQLDLTFTPVEKHVMSAQQSTRSFAPHSRLQPALIKALLLFVIGLILLPMLATLVAALSGSLATGRGLAATLLPDATTSTLVLALCVGFGTAGIGTITAWLVTAYRFKGSNILEIALALPLAFPAYVVAYAYTVFLDYPGPLQSTLRNVTGWQGRDYWFPDVRSIGGAILMFVLVLYPYVYLLARAAFMRQSAGAFQSARTLGASPVRAFLSVSAPMARPAIAAGVALVLMETLADFGTVAHFGVQTFATAIYQSWFSFGDRAAAAQLSLCLLIVVLLLATLERKQRGKISRFGRARHEVRMAAIALIGWRATVAFIVCFAPVLFGFILPVLLMFQLAITSDQNLFSPRYIGFIVNSLKLAAMAATVTVTAAMLLGFAKRFMPSRLTSFGLNVAGLGYAVPGGVIAIGLLVPFAALDNAIDAWLRANFNVSSGLLFTGSAVLLVIAYLVRFLSPALGSFETGMESVKPNMDRAARTLGSTTQNIIMRIHLPLLSTSLLTGALIVFVDVMKELPATLILRPFNYDTLAVQAYRLASDERLADAAVPSLVIVAFGMLPVILLCRTLAKRE